MQDQEWNEWNKRINDRTGLGYEWNKRIRY